MVRMKTVVNAEIQNTQCMQQCAQARNNIKMQAQLYNKSSNMNWNYTSAQIQVQVLSADQVTTCEDYNAHAKIQRPAAK